MSQERIVLLHGIARSARHMRPLERALQQHGYDTLNLTYPSRHHTIETLAKQVAERLPHDTRTTHIIGYSMGGLLARVIMHKHRPANTGCIIHVGTPNHGSEVANLLRNSWLYQSVYGPAGQQLTTDTELFDNEAIDYPLGIIAGTSTYWPFSRIVPLPNDSKVSVASTKLEGMRDHICVKSCHTFMPSNQLIHHQALHFLRYQRFDLNQAV